MRRFPIMDGPSIPWRLIAPHERQALANHSQNLEDLAEREGLCCSEAVAVLEDRRWCSMDLGAAKARLRELELAWADHPLRRALIDLLIDDGQDALEDPCGHAEREKSGFARIHISRLADASAALEDS